MRVAELMTTDPESCVPTDSCSVAGEIMRRRNCGFVPVVDDIQNRKVIGVVTDRDIALHLLQLDAPGSEIPVRACMTRPAKVVVADTELRDAVDVMERAAVHRLPVVDLSGRLLGVLSLKDIAIAARREWPWTGPHPVERQLTELVEAISAAQ